MGSVTRTWRRRSPWSTSIWDMRPGAIFRRRAQHCVGHAVAPAEIVLLASVPSLHARPDIRIYIGTEPAQHRAERVLVWSILKNRDSSRTYRIYLMSDLVGFNNRNWKTGFTNYRYAIPALAGATGRAIYNDVDQIYLQDPALLFDTDMGKSAVLSINERETSVMLLDCARLAPLWRLEDAQRNHKHSHFRRLVEAAGLWGQMDRTWNSRDHEYQRGISKLLHYTTLHMQPWEPFPEVLRYRTNPHAEDWFALEHEADEAGFALARFG